MIGISNLVIRSILYQSICITLAGMIQNTQEVILSQELLKSFRQNLETLSPNLELELVLSLKPKLN